MDIKILITLFSGAFLVLLFFSRRSLWELFESLLPVTRSRNQSNSTTETLNTLRIRIPRMRFDPIEKFIQYQMIIKYKDRTWDTWRRYSEFRTFSKRHNFQSTARFPPKSSFYDIVSGNDRKVEFTDKRRKDLEYYVNTVVQNDATFGQLCVFMKEGKDRVGPSGYFFAVPADISFDDIKLNPSRLDLVENGLKAFETFLEQTTLIDQEPVKQPWSRFAHDDKKKVSCFAWEDGDKFHISIKALIPCNKDALFDLILDNDMRHEWDEDQEKQETLDGFLITPSTIKKEDLSQNMHFLLQKSASLSLEEEEEVQTACKSFSNKHGYEIKFGVVEYSRMKSPAPLVVAKRDFLTLCLYGRHKETGENVSCITSVEYNLPTELSKEVQNAKCVRAKHIVSGTTLRTSGPNTEFMTVSMVDPGAYVPPSIIKMFAPKRAMELPNLASLAKHRRESKKAGASLFLESSAGT